MKLSKEALIEVISIVQAGLLGVKDASIGLRELDLIPAGEDHVLTLSEEYVKTHPRVTDEE